MSIPDASHRPAPGSRRVRFVAGVVLIAVSFTVYLGYFVIVLFLPFSAPMKVTAIVAASVLSWAGFGLGIFLAGHEGYHWVRRLCTRKRRQTKT